MADRASRTIRKLDSFKRILELERSKGYSDTAVYGGLDRFLERCADVLAKALGAGIFAFDEDFAGENIPLLP